MIEEPAQMLEAPPPRRKVIRRHIAATIEKLVNETPKYRDSLNNIDPGEIAAEIDQVCFCRYSEDSEGFRRCLEYKVELARIKNFAGEDKIASSTAEFLALMSISLPILIKAMNDQELEREHSDIKRSEVEWLVHFIKMCLAKSDIANLEQNISITYFSCFLPLFRKLNREISTERMDQDMLMFGQSEGFEWLF